MKIMLIQLRAERNLTQERLAKLAGVKPIAIYKMEHAQPVARETVDKVLAVLGVSAEEVAGLVFSKSPAQRVNRAFIPWRGARKEA